VGLLGCSFAETPDNIGAPYAFINYAINGNLSVNSDGLNLTNVILKYYANSTDQPRAFNSNARRYYLGGTYRF
jgi:iron complex outermembrane receptor protein